MRGIGTTTCIRKTPASILDVCELCSDLAEGRRSVEGEYRLRTLRSEWHLVLKTALRSAQLAIIRQRYRRIERLLTSMPSLSTSARIRSVPPRRLSRDRVVLRSRTSGLR